MNDAAAELKQATDKESRNAENGHRGSFTGRGGRGGRRNARGGGILPQPEKPAKTEKKGKGGTEAKVSEDVKELLTLRSLNEA